MQFHLLPIRDWNFAILLMSAVAVGYCNFTYSLLGIETIAWLVIPSGDKAVALQFHLLPIRDWNELGFNCSIFKGDCNFTYSLLGIETQFHLNVAILM